MICARFLCFFNIGVIAAVLNDADSFSGKGGMDESRDERDQRRETGLM